MQDPGWLGDDVSLAYAAALRSYGRERGLLTHQERAPDREPVSLSSARVNGEAFGQALNLLSESLHDPLLGLRFGTQAGPGSYGALALATACASNLGGAIQRLTRYESLTSTLGRAEVRVMRDRVVLNWQATRPDVSSVVGHAAVAGWLSFGRLIAGEAITGVQVALTGTFSAPRSEYEQVLGAEVRDGAPYCALSLPREQLDIGTRFGDATLTKSLDRWLSWCVSGACGDRQRPTTSAVMRCLAERPGLGDLSEEEVSGGFGIHPRSLQRRLAGEGTCFRTLLDASRAEMALLELLYEDHHLLQIVSDVGFGEQSSLCRAFRRWAGCAPLQLRKRLAPLTAGAALPLHVAPTGESWPSPDQLGK